MTSRYLRHARNAMGRLRRWGMFGVLSAIFVLAGCGGGASFTGTGTNPNPDPTPTPTAAVGHVNLVAASTTLSTDADTPAKGDLIRAIVTDDKFRALPGITVTFTSNGGALVNIQATTDATGTASAILTNGGSAQNGDTININASAGGKDAVPSPLAITVVSPGGTGGTPAKSIL